MMNEFYHDRIMTGLDNIENALMKLNYGDAFTAVEALADVRQYVTTVFELSKYGSHIWSDDIGPDWMDGPAPVNPKTGRAYTDLDRWAAHYELMRRRIMQKFEAGYTLELTPRNPE